ncbi:MAG: 2-hydroxyacid dehydrogenase [Thermoprotei archaeon]
MHVCTTDKLPDEAMVALGPYEVRWIEAGQVEDCDVIMCWGLTEEALREARSLKAIQTFSAGVDHLPFRVIPKGVRIFSNAGAYSIPVAEHAFALILYLAKRLSAGKEVPRLQLQGKTLLVFGAGGIGSQAARLAKAFGMKTVGASRHPAPSPEFDQVLSADCVDEVLPTSDVVLIAAPLNRGTAGFFNSSRLRMMKQGAILVNVGRGEIVDETALYNVLRSGKICYGTDVLWRDREGKEGTTYRFQDIPCFISTPHVASGNSKDVRERAMLMAAKNVRSYLDRGTAQNEVNPSDYL